MSSRLDYPQIIQDVHDINVHALQVKGISGTLVTEQFDYIAATYPTSSQEVYTYKSGGSGGTTVATVTVNYTDSTKANLLNVAKT